MEDAPGPGSPSNGRLGPYGGRLGPYGGLFSL
jgi:hypothetical protein